MENGVVILTGGPAVGKNTVAELLAKTKKRCAVIDVDDVRQMVRRPHTPPWDGLSGSRQQQLGVLNACALAANFVGHGYDVLVLDVVTDATAATYREGLSGVAPLIIVQLVVDLNEARRRASTRPIYLTGEEFELLHRQQPSFTTADVLLDTTTLTPHETARRIVSLIRSH